MKKTMRVCTVAAATIGMILASSQVARAANDEDIDAMDDAALLRDLNAELDDVTEVPATAQELEDLFVNALHDDGDGDDPDENAISWAELEAEAVEADTTVRREVHNAMKKAWADAHPHAAGDSPIRLAIDDVAHWLLGMIRSKK